MTVGLSRKCREPHYRILKTGVDTESNTSSGNGSCGILNRLHVAASQRGRLDEHHNDYGAANQCSCFRVSTSMMSLNYNSFAEIPLISQLEPLLLIQHQQTCLLTTDTAFNLA